MKRIFVILALLCCVYADSNAQVGVIVGPRYGYGPRYPRPPRPRPYQQRRKEPKFTPVVIVSVGYGFPNLDKNQFPELGNDPSAQSYYKGNYTQMGPITGSIDYQFSRTTSLGILVTHGTVSVPYYDPNAPATPSFTGSFDNWSFMLNLIRYMPVPGTKIEPYFRLAAGINSWKQNYTNPDGTPVTVLGGNQPQDFAYQVGLGAKLNLSKNAGIFAEAGYGKYIVHGGLTFKF